MTKDSLRTARELLALCLSLCAGWGRVRINRVMSRPHLDAERAWSVLREGAIRKAAGIFATDALALPQDSLAELAAKAQHHHDSLRARGLQMLLPEDKAYPAAWRECLDSDMPPFALALGNTLSQPAVFMRRRVWELVGSFDETLHCVLDYDYWLRAAVAGCRFERLDQPLARMRMHPTSKTATREPDFWTETVRMLERLFAQAALPQPLLAVRSRALARARWLAAITLASAGQDQEAERHARRAVVEFELGGNLEDLDFVLQRLLYSRRGRLLAPERLERRLQALGFDRPEFAELAAVVDEEYLSRLRHRTNSMARAHALLILLRALMARPRRLLTWGMRRALLDVLRNRR